MHETTAFYYVDKLATPIKAKRNTLHFQLPLWRKVYCKSFIAKVNLY